MLLICYGIFIKIVGGESANDVSALVLLDFILFLVIASKF